MEGLNGLALLVRLAQSIVDDVVVGNNQLMAEDGRPIELPHEGLSKFFEGVAENDHLGMGSKVCKKVVGPRKGSETGNDVLNQRHCETVFFEKPKAVSHQNVVIRFIAGRAQQPVNAGLLSNGNPDLRDQHSFEVERDDCLTCSVECGHATHSIIA